MGKLADFREVIKELKHKKRGEATTKVCPKCQSPRIKISSGVDVYPRFYGLTPGHYVCLDCGYKGPLIMEQTKAKEEKTD